MKDPAFPFYAGDFLTGVMHFTMEERGMYITLLAYQWANNSIPKKRLGLLVGSSWEDLPQELRSKFVEDGDIIKNPRLEAEREKRAAYKRKQSENGKKGGRPKNPNKTQSITQTQTQKKPLENESEYEKENEVEIVNEEKVTFDKFWELYDHKKSRGKCLKLWKHLSEGEKLKIMVHLQKYIPNTYKDGTFPSRKHPETYLRNKSWEDEITIVRAKGHGGLSPSVEKELNALLERGSAGGDPQEMGGTSEEEAIQSRFGLKDFESEERVRRTIELPHTARNTSG